VAAVLSIVNTASKAKISNDKYNPLRISPTINHGLKIIILFKIGYDYSFNFTLSSLDKLLRLLQGFSTI
jgi:hypothetical protein